MTRHQKLVLVLLLGAQFMIAVDFSILNVALPAIGRGLGFGLANLQWVATAFALPAAGFTLLFGRIGDLVGRRRLFLGGLVLLLVASLVGGFAATPAILLTARVAQGLATAIATPAALSLLTTSFPEGPLRERALGLNGALLSAGFTAGALLGGLLTDLLSWHWAFLINVPVALVILIAAPVLISESRHPEHRPLDLPGAATVTAGLLALILGITTAGHHGWDDAAALLEVGAGIVLLVAFYFIELRSPNPLAPVRVLRRRTVSWGNFGGLIVFSMESSMVFLMTLYLQQVLGYSPMVAGLVFGLPGIVAVLTGVFAPRLIGRVGARASLVIGLAIQGAANLLLLLVSQSHSGLIVVLVATSVGFFGHIYGVVAYIVTATSGLPDEEQGLATGLSTMTQQVGITIGIPILSAVTAGYGADVLGGIHVAIVVDVAITAVATTLIAVFLRRRALVPVPQPA
jgi:EmrB/QacA subfamily drug resistance transporter